ncbi:MAG: hypothetical protein GY725_01710 [bacterium]|nr:hypothetical protein [bacterium]
MAVLAQLGRELDNHLRQLEKWGAEIAPDLIVYQWFVNDMGFDKSDRPRSARRIWTRLFFHRFLATHSYMWFLLDYQVSSLFAKPGESYDTYMDRQFAEGTPDWQRLVEVFDNWLVRARELTPRIVVVIYPHVNSGIRSLPELYARFAFRQPPRCGRSRGDGGRAVYSTRRPGRGYSRAKQRR